MIQTFFQYSLITTVLLTPNIISEIVILVAMQSNYCISGSFPHHRKRGNDEDDDEVRRQRKRTRSAEDKCTDKGSGDSSSEDNSDSERVQVRTYRPVRPATGPSRRGPHCVIPPGQIDILALRRRQFGRNRLPYAEIDAEFVRPEPPPPPPNTPRRSCTPSECGRRGADSDVEAEVAKDARADSDVESEAYKEARDAEEEALLGDLLQEGLAASPSSASGNLISGVADDEPADDDCDGEYVLVLRPKADAHPHLPQHPVQ